MRQATCPRGHLMDEANTGQAIRSGRLAESFCRSCHRENHRRRYHEDAVYRARLLSKVRARYERVKGDPIFRARARAAGRQHYRRRKLETFNAYGGAHCACCGEQFIEFLTLDHINGGGSRERRRMRGKDGGGGVRFYTKLREVGFPPGYQVLCYNCNMGRALCGGECPHQRSARLQVGYA